LGRASKDSDARFPGHPAVRGPIKPGKPRAPAVWASLLQRLSRLSLKTPWPWSSSNMVGVISRWSRLVRRGRILDRCFMAPSRKLRTVVFSKRRINRRAVSSAKRVPASRAAVCNFHIDFGVALATIGQPQPSQGCWLEKRPGEALAVGTMTHRSGLWLDICRASDRATMAPAVDLLEKPHAPRRAAVGTLHSPQLSHRTQVGA
jgi:hypothetical protein